jgi:hypothetical protein
MKLPWVWYTVQPSTRQAAVALLRSSVISHARSPPLHRRPGRPRRADRPPDTPIAAIRAAHPGLTETRLTQLGDGTFTDVWRWDSTEQMRAALADMPRFGAQAGAAWSLTHDAAHVDGEIVDER